MFTKHLSGFNNLPIVPKWNWNWKEMIIWRFTRNLPIVPKWNWNTLPTLIFQTPVLLPIVPKWNWNLTNFAIGNHAIFSTNRTKVELKQRHRRGVRVSFPTYQSYQSGIETASTFKLMSEVKGYQSYQSGIETGDQPPAITFVSPLPIVPKWNWNRHILKCQKPKGTATNRTKVELKLKEAQSFKANSGSTNRTKVELKLHPKNPVMYVVVLPIVPKWNWNSTTVPDNTVLFTIYQSYQSGIETYCGYNILVLRRNYQSYQSGIETVYLHGTSGITHSLPIVPKWNWNGWSYPNTRRRKTYQSYQSGIETQLQLRHSSLEMTLPIVPKWNWNFNPGKGYVYLRILPIVPKWNWNGIQ